jgi:Zn-dependent peptidase ImmA (M78 family)
MENENITPRIGLARNIARKLLKDSGISYPPVLLNELLPWIRKNQPVQVVGWNFGDNVSGIQLTEGDRSVIGYNVNQHQNRQRFTVAHEIGHLMMGHTSNNNSDPIEDTKNPYEIEAFAFAAELLIPLESIKHDYSPGVMPKSLAFKYRVSEEAMWKRLMDCHLIR